MGAFRYRYGNVSCGIKNSVMRAYIWLVISSLCFILTLIYRMKIENRYKGEKRMSQLRIQNNIDLIVYLVFAIVSVLEITDII